MQIIKKISKMIEEELEGACEYARHALKYKEEYPSLGKVLYEFSMDELEHVNTLHTEVVKMIESYRRDHGDPPEAMQAIYDYVHEQQIDKAAKVRNYQDQYKTY